MRRFKHKQYALYYIDRDTLFEELLFTGSRKELSKYLEVDERTIVFYGTPTWFKRNKTGYRVYPINDYEGDDIYD